MRKQVRILLAVLACVCIALSCMWIPQHRLSGNLTISQADLHARDRAFVLQNFAQVEDYEQLTHAVLQFAYTHFTYDLDSIPAYQNFSFGRFANNDFTGVCFDFANFYKTVFCIVAEAKGWTDIKCLCINAYKQDSGHTFNLLVFEPGTHPLAAPGKCLYALVDVTNDHTAHREGRQKDLVSLRNRWLAPQRLSTAQVVEDICHRLGWTKVTCIY